MSTNTCSIPNSTERIRPRRDTSTIPRLSAGTCTRRPSVVMATATWRRFFRSNRLTWFSVACATPTPNEWCWAILPVAVNLCAITRSGQSHGTEGIARLNGWLKLRSMDVFWVSLPGTEKADYEMFTKIVNSFVFTK